MLLATSTDSEEILHEKWFQSIVGLKIPDTRDIKAGTARRLLREILRKIEAGPIQRKGVLHANIARLAKIVGLKRVDKEILTFLVLLHTQSALQACLESVENLSLSAVKDVFAEVLQCNKIEVRAALAYDSLLCTSGLVQVDHSGSDLTAMLNLLDGLANSLLDECSDVLRLFEPYFVPAAAPRFGLTDFGHLQAEIDSIQELLMDAARQRVKGINVLIYGESGVGKTELAKTLTAALGFRLMEVSHEDENTDLEEKMFRFRSLLLAQKILAGMQDAVILVDEASDLFPDRSEFFGRTNSSGAYKAWTTAILESNPCPTIWISNSVHHIDRSFGRRFRHSLHMRTPVRSVRRAILQKHFGDLPVRTEWVDKAAGYQNLTLAMMEELSKIGRLRGETNAFRLEALLDKHLEAKFELMGLSLKSSRPAVRPVTEFRLDLLNPTQNVGDVIHGLKSRPRGTLLLYGPSGVGKTRLAYYIAEQIDKEVSEKKASDLLSCWVGDTEKRIAEMFRAAKSEDALLVLDECDSLFQSRDKASHFWEITEVNELLKGMEQYDGVLICCTNLMRSLDPAVFRRFDLKIGFHYLKTEQAWQMFLGALDAMGQPMMDSEALSALRQELNRLANITPGLFSTVIRQAELLGIRYGGRELIKALEDECRREDEGNNPVLGFTA
jgi:SpoVK/Ycf46/Vps4 family AAA+-type ATPase